MSEGTRWMRVREVADRLGCSTTHVLQSLKSKRIPGGEVVFTDGRGRNHWRVLRSEFEHYLARLLEERESHKAPDVPVVYFIQERDNPAGPVKIGMSRSLRLASRMSALQTGSPVKLHMVASIVGDEQTERELHELFKAQRLHGEWFAMSPALRDLVDDAASRPVAKLLG